MYFSKKISLLLVLVAVSIQYTVSGQTRLLRQPDMSDNHIVFTYGSDVWAYAIATQKTTRITSTPAVESNP